MSLTWQKLKNSPQVTLEVEVLEQIKYGLQEGRRVRVGESILTRKDLKDVQMLIDKEYRKNGGK